MLAKLELSTEEEVDFSAKFDRLLAFVEQVKSFDAVRDGKLSALARLDLRRDNPVVFEWPEGTRHDYRVPQVIQTEGEG